MNEEVSRALLPSFASHHTPLGLECDEIPGRNLLGAQDDVHARIGIDDLRELAHFQRVGAVFERFLHGATSKFPEISSLRRRPAVGMDLREFVEFRLSGGDGLAVLGEDVDRLLLRAMLDLLALGILPRRRTGAEATAFKTVSATLRTLDPKIDAKIQRPKSITKVLSEIASMLIDDDAEAAYSSPIPVP
jgi:hypothetical protein